MYLNDFEKHIDAKILARGKDYYLTSCVLSLSEVAERSFEAEVEGTDIYLVEVELDGNQQIVYTSCDCPYDLGVYCKHQAAVFYALCDIYKHPRKEPACAADSIKSTHQNPEILPLLSGRSKDELAAFLTLLAMESEEIGNRIELYFSDYQNKDDETAQCRQLIRSYVDRYTNKRGYIDDKDAEYAVQGAEIVLERANVIYMQHSPLQAAELILCVVNEMLYVLAGQNDEAGYFEAVIDESFAILDEMIADEDLTVEEQESLFYRLLQEAADSRYDQWDEWRLDLLDRCIDLAVTDPIKKQLDNYFCKLMEDCSAQDDWSRKYFIERVGSLRYALIQEYENQQAAQDFLQTNLHHPKFREMAINQAIAEQNYGLAVKYAREGAEQDKAYPGLVAKWQEFCYQACKSGGDLTEQRKLAREFILAGRFEYYLDLKNSYPADDWKDVYPEIISWLENQKKTYMDAYFRILIEEGEKGRLLSRVKERPDLIERFYNHLMPEYTEEVWSIFSRHIEQTASRANKRRDYEAVCDMIRKMKKAGGEEAARAIIQLLRIRYYRRPAFQDELFKIR